MSNQLFALSFQDTDEWTTLTSKGGIDLLNNVISVELGVPLQFLNIR